MSAENLEVQKRFNKIRQFTQSASQGLVHSTVLQGPDSSSTFLIYAAIFPTPDLKSNFFLIVDDCIELTDESYWKVCSRIVNSEVPEQPTPLSISNDTELRAGFERYQAMENMPSIVLAFSQAERDQNEAAKLFTVLGISPRVALSEIQYYTKVAMLARSYVQLN